jgi:hypothetical protein
MTKLNEVSAKSHKNGGGKKKAFWAQTAEGYNQKDYGHKNVYKQIIKYIQCKQWECGQSHFIVAKL